MPDHTPEPNTTAVMKTLANTLHQASQAQQIQEADILQERARQYAQATPDPTPPHNTRTMLGFRLGDTHYALDVIAVRGVRHTPPVTRVPSAAPYYRGVMNVRGQVITQIDLAMFLEPSTPPQPTPELIIAAHKGHILGFGASRIHGVLVIPAGGVRPLENNTYTHGIYRGEVGDIFLLDTLALFADDRLKGGPHHG